MTGGNELSEVATRFLGGRGHRNARPEVEFGNIMSLMLSGRGVCALVLRRKVLGAINTLAGNITHLELLVYQRSLRKYEEGRVFSGLSSLQKSEE